MTHNSPLKPLASRSNEPNVVLVESKSFVAFDRSMDVQLAQLVARWAHMAAPRAQQAERIQRRFSH